MKKRTCANQTIVVFYFWNLEYQIPNSEIWKDAPHFLQSMVSKELKDLVKKKGEFQ